MRVTGDVSKHFTVEQANRCLPLVSRIVDDLVKYHARWQEMIAAAEFLAGSSSEHAGPRAESLQEDIQRTASEIDRFLKELRDLGVQFKGFEEGLVDFPATLDDREILLCWKHGEDAVTHWHEVDAGFAGRQVIDDRIL